MRAKIIVVDSEPVVRSVIKAILEREGYEVTSLEDPKTAVDVIKKTPPELIITNVTLPGISGHDAMRLFKEYCPGIPVLMVSGLPESAVIQDWMSEDGFDAFPKPFSADQLAAKVKGMLVSGSSDHSAMPLEVCKPAAPVRRTSMPTADE